MIRWILLFSLLWVPKAWAGALPERWDMDVGDARRLRLEAKMSLRLSQKHVLDVEDQGQGSYQIIALKSGIVYLRAVDEKGTIQQSWIVNVATRSESEKTERWKNLLCHEPGIHCHPESALVTGQTDSLPWLHKARDLCDRNPPCRFQAILSPESRDMIARRVQEELKLNRVTIDPEGFMTLESACLVPDPKRDEQWRQWIKERYNAPVQIRCQDQADGRFRLDIVALARKISESDLSNPLQYGPVRLLPSDPIEVFLQGLSQKSRTRILAHPQVSINLGSALEVSDGMDIATLAPQRDQTLEIWKAVGFQLKLKLLEQRGDAVRAAVDLQLSRPREGQRSLDRSGMQTETWLALDHVHQVGQIQARTEGLEESRIPWLGAIPILGALFRWDVASVGDSEVSLFLRLQKLESGDESPSLPDEL